MATAPQSPLAAFPPVRQRRAVEERDLVTRVFGGTLVVLFYQAITANHLWAIGWIGLGVAVLLLKRRASVKFILVLELPIFLSLICYSASTLYLLTMEQAYDFVNDPVAIEAAWLALGGSACFLAGMAIMVLRPVQEWTPDAPPVAVTERQAVILYAVGFLNAEVLSRVAPASVWAIAYTFGLCVPISLFMLLKMAMDSPKRWVGTWRFYLWLVALVLWSVGSVLGGIFGSTILILTMFLTQQIHRSYLVVFAGIVFLALLAPLLQDTKSSYRQQLASGVQASQRALSEVVEENVRRTLVHGDLETYRNGLDQLVDRLCTFDVWLRVKRHMDTYQDFAHGRTIWDALVYGFVPRVIWADKPITGGANTLAEQYAEMVIGEGTSVGVGAISEFYINNGAWAVLAGMFVFGLMGGAVLMRGWHDNVQPLGTMSGILAFSLLVRPETNVTDVLGGFIRIIFLWWVMRLWITRQHRKQPRPAVPRPGAPLPWNPPPA